MDENDFIKLHQIQGEILSKKLEIYRLLEKKHKGRQGKKLEDALTKLLIDFLPERYGVVTGKLVNLKGMTSRQSDVIIYDKLFNPSLIYEDKNDKYVPLEAARCVIEVKSKFTISSFKSALLNLASIRELGRAYTNAISGIIYKSNIYIPPINFYIFAFDKYSKNYSTILNLIEKELDTLKREKDDTYLSYLPNAICINGFCNVSLMSDSQKEEHQCKNNKYYKPIFTPYSMDNLKIGILKTKDDSLFYFLSKVLEEADSIPPIKSRFLSNLFVKNTFDCLVKDFKLYKAPNS